MKGLMPVGSSMSVYRSICAYRVLVFNPFMPCVPLIWTLANRVDPDQTPQNAASDQGLHCLHHKNIPI